MKETVRDEVVEFAEHGIDVARLSSSNSSKTCTIAISATPGIYVKTDLEINKPFSIQIPNYGLKELKATRIDTYDIDIKIKDVPISPNVCFIEGIENSEFSTEEKQLITSQLDHLAERVSSSEKISQELKQDFSKNIAYVKSSMDRMGRKDWLLFSMALLGNFASGAFYAPDVAMEMASTVSTLLPQFLNSIVHAFPVINNVTFLEMDS